MKIRLNLEGKELNDMLDAIVKNGGFCPCKLEKTPENKCMCREFREMKSGECHCGLYIKEE